jgi:hypothetical protein
MSTAVGHAAVDSAKAIAQATAAEVSEAVRAGDPAEGGARYAGSAPINR